MTRIRVTADYDATPDAVWRAVEHVDTHVDWMADAETIRFLTEQTAGVGTRFECVTRIGPVRLTDRMEITEWEPGRSMGVRHRGVVTGTGRFTIEPLDDGRRTRFSWEEELHVPVVAGRTASARRSAVRRCCSGSGRGNLRRLRPLVERDEHRRSDGRCCGGHDAGRRGRCTATARRRVTCATVRVLMLTWEFPPRSVGGVGAHVDGLSQALAAAGHDVALLTLSHPGVAGDGVVGGVRVLRARTDLPWLPDDDIVARVASANHHLVQLSARLVPWRPDVVHAHDWQVAWAADTLATLYDAKLVATFHSTERGQHGGRVPPGTPSTVHAVESWLAHSAAGRARQLAASWSARSSTASSCRPSARTSSPTASTRRGGRRARCPGSRPPLVFTWGRVQYEKGFQVLADGRCGCCARGCPGIECVIGGRGSYLPELQSQIDLEGVADLIALPGFLSDDRLRDLVHRAGCRRHPVAVRAVRHRRPRGARRRRPARRRPHRRPRRARSTAPAPACCSSRATPPSWRRASR